MSNPTLEGMARADWERHYDTLYEEDCANKEEWERGMRAALLWLASNVSDEMASASVQVYLASAYDSADESEEWMENTRAEHKRMIAAALRAAAGSATPEVK